MRTSCRGLLIYPLQLATRPIPWGVSHLRPRSDEGAEQVLHWREAEDVPVDVLPPGFLLLQARCKAKVTHYSDTRHW